MPRLSDALRNVHAVHVNVLEFLAIFAHQALINELLDATVCVKVVSSDEMFHG